MKQWTDEERDIIRESYKHTKQSLRDLADRLDTTPASVKGQVAYMGIAKSDDRRPWTEPEIERLYDLLGKHSPRKVGRLMNRSINSVIVKAHRTSVSLRCRDGWFTKREVMEIVGHDHRWVKRRIDSGAIKATPHYDKIPSKVGQSAWHIDEKDLVDFIRRYPEELIGCNLDIVLIVDMLAGIRSNQ